MTSQQRKGPFNFDLRKPQRTGYMLKQGRLHRVFKRRFFVLYPGFLVYYEDDIKWKSDLAKGDTLGGRIGALYLKNSTCKIAKNAPKGCKYGFAIEAPDPKNKRQSYLINANDKRDRDAWIEKVHHCTPNTPRNSPIVTHRTKPETHLAVQHPVIAVRQSTVDDAALVGSTKVDHEEENDQITDLNDDMVPEMAVRHGTADTAALLGSNSTNTESNGAAVTAFDDELLTRVLSRDEGENSNDSDVGSDVNEAGSDTENLNESGSEDGSAENGNAENGSVENNTKDAGEKEKGNSTETVHEEDRVEERKDSNGSCSEAREVACDTASKTNESGEVEVTVTVTILPDKKTLPEEEETTAEVLPVESEHSAEPDSKSEQEGSEVTPSTAAENRSETNGKTAEAASGEPEATNGEPEATNGEPEATNGEPEATNGEPEATNGEPEATNGEPEATNGELETAVEAEKGEESDTSSTGSSSSDEVEQSPIRQASEANPGAPTITVEKVDTLKRKDESNEDEEPLPDILVVARPRRRSSVPFIEKRGFLYKMGGKRKSWKLRYFILQPGAFSYYKNNPNSKPIGTVKLKNLQIFYPAVGERKQSFQFTVHTESQWNSRNDWVMAAVNEKEMKEWIEAFKSAAAIDLSAGN